MSLEPHDYPTWAFRVIGKWHLDAPQKAKQKVASEHGVEYGDLRARVVYDGGPFVNSVVVVTQVRGPDDADAAPSGGGGE